MIVPGHGCSVEILKHPRHRIYVPQNRHLTALMTSDRDHIRMVGRYGQGQHTHVTSRSQGQSQGHQGRFQFPVFT